MWKSIESYEKDGTMVLLKIAHEPSGISDNPLEDSAEPTRTIGFNNAENDGEDEWKFAGWDWSNDFFTEGRGTPVAWMPLPAV